MFSTLPKLKIYIHKIACKTFLKIMIYGKKVKS